MVFPARVRTALYAIGFVGTPTMAYLADNDVISAFTFGLWVVVSSAIFALAGINVTPDKR